MPKWVLLAALAFCGFVLANRASADIVQFVSNLSFDHWGYEDTPTSFGQSLGYTEQDGQTSDSAPNGQANWSGHGVSTTVTSNSIAETAATYYSQSEGNLYLQTNYTDQATAQIEFDLTVESQATVTGYSTYFTNNGIYAPGEYGYYMSAPGLPNPAAYSGTVTFQAIPEPTLLSLLAIPAFMLVVRRRRADFAVG